MIEAEKAVHPKKMLCRVMGFPKSSVLDAFDKSIVGWSMGESATTTLVVNAVEMVITRRNPVIVPVHHSDRGTQHTGIAFSERLGQLGLTPSSGGGGDAVGEGCGSLRELDRPRIVA